MGLETTKNYILEDQTLQSSLNRTYKDRFLFTFTLPDALRDIRTNYVKLNEKAGISKDAIEFTLYGVNVPEIITKSENAPYSGSNLYISSHTRQPYNPVVVRFHVDNRFANYYAIYEWLNFIYDSHKGYFDAQNLSNHHDITAYQTNLSVAALDNYNNPIVQWIFTHAFPSQLSAIDYNYTDSGEIDCSATFEFAQMFVRHIALQQIRLDDAALKNAEKNQSKPELPRL